MTDQRGAANVVEELLEAMVKTVTSYAPSVGRTSSTVDGLIQGTAVFPGGAGLWRGRNNGGSLPGYFPMRPVMLVGHNFDSERGYAESLKRGGEGNGKFWTSLLEMLEAADLRPEACFFTNALRGLKPGKAEGQMPSTPGYKNECQRFLQRQVEIVQPCAVVALGANAVPSVRRLKVRYVAVKHPSNWDFRKHSTRGALLRTEGEKLREFLNSLEGESSEVKDHKSASRSMEKEQRIKSTGESMKIRRVGTDAWGFRLGTGSSFLMRLIEQGGKSRRDLREEFEKQFPGSTGKSTFGAFISDVGRPFGSANASRCIPIPKEEGIAIHLDPKRTRKIKDAIAAGMLKEINRLEDRKFPKVFRREVDAIVRKYNAPLEVDHPD